MRCGIGFDAHAFGIEKKKRLILGGIEIEYGKGLEGYSDADVLTHAVMDALLGASGLGDIGIHFPDTDMEYKDISSIKLLSRVAVMVRGKGFEIENIDAVIIIQEPKVSEFFESMEKNISAALNIGADRVNIKATTTEHMGFCGRKEGIAAQSVALLK
jgi:2-C-methyl-D-erythritol 2,4-cyclodiphosphate synthase